MTEGGGTAKTRGPRLPPTEARRRILAVAGRILDASGYPATTMEEIAAKAGVAKKTVYRWWPNKVALAAEVVAERAVVHTVPDRGDTRAELLDLFDAIVNYASGIDGAHLTMLRAAVDGDAQAERTIVARVIAPRRDIARAVVQRGIARGDLPVDLDIDTLLDMWNGLAAYRAGYRSTPLLSPTIEQLVELALAGHAPRLGTA